MPHHAPPFRLLTLSLQTTWMLAEAQTVMAARLFGMAGLWPVAPGEGGRMLLEKWPAFLTSGLGAGFAALAGEPPDRIASAALEPIRRTTRANSRRLTRAKRRARRNPD